MLRRADPDGASPPAPTPFTWDGRPCEGREGDTVAAALLAVGAGATRAHPVTGEGRGPFCMMGTCYECLVEIDGEPNRQACQVRLRAGMVVAPQKGARR